MAALADYSPLSVFPRDVPLLTYSDPAQGGSGALSVNADKSLVKWQWIAARLNGQVPISVPSSGTVIANLDVSSQQGQAGDLEVSTLLLNASNGRVGVRPYVNAGTVNHFLSNVNICDRLMFGTAQLPGLLGQSIYCLPKTSWQFTLQDLSGGTNSVTAAVFGRRFTDRNREALGNARRRLELLQWMHPYWLGPEDPTSLARSGPEVSLAANRQVTLTFPIPSSADFLCRWILDDSSSTSGNEPSLYAQVSENYSGRGLVDLPGVVGPSSTLEGIHWRDFIACPSVAVTGFPGSSNVVRAAGVGSPRGGWTHLFPRNTQVSIKFTSLDAGTITLRVALVGWLIYAKEMGRQLSADFQAAQSREAQARALMRQFGGGPINLFGGGVR